VVEGADDFFGRERDERGRVVSEEEEGF